MATQLGPKANLADVFQTSDHLLTVNLPNPRRMVVMKKSNYWDINTRHARGGGVFCILSTNFATRAYNGSKERIFQEIFLSWKNFSIF